MANDKKPFRFSIRSKLLILTLTFLLVPYTAYRSLLELETSLRAGLETSLLEVGNSISAFLSNSENLLRQDISEDERFLFIHELRYPILLDGYGDEWSEFLPWANVYTSENDKKFSFRLMLGRYGKSLYIFLDVKDQKTIYHDPTYLDQLDSDHVTLFFQDENGLSINYFLAPEAPGKFFPFRLNEYWLYEQDIGLADPELRKVFLTNIQAYWQLTDSGYSVELEIPWYMLPYQFGLIAYDIDYPDTEMNSVATFDESNKFTLSRLIQQSEQLNDIIQSLGVTKNRRIWVLDTLGQVVAVDGSLKAELEKPPINLLYEILLPKTYERFTDELSEASRLEGKEIQNALNGKADLRWRSSEDEKAVILSVAVPIKRHHSVIGTVVVEETTNGIQLLKRSALTNLFNKTLIVFSAITILILLFTSYLSFRLRRLSHQANRAIDEHGRVVGEITINESNDELGDLAENYQGILQRLGQYHDYLEGMAGKLSHELRTPITIVQSSLENMAHEVDGEKQTLYMKRAQDAIHQLNQIITRLSEATRLEHSLNDYEFETIDLNQFMENCVSAYRDAFKPLQIDLEINCEQQSIQIAPDLIVQLFDKLLANAVDFHTPGTAIVFAVSEDEQLIIIDVINQGAALPETLRTQLFQSMTSKRSEKNDREPHLGLGLYIARLIAEFHQGSIQADNLPEQSAVRFRISLPKSR